VEQGTYFTKGIMAKQVLEKRPVPTIYTSLFGTTLKTGNKLFEENSGVR
jgi:hypothetical protein